MRFSIILIFLISFNGIISVTFQPDLTEFIIQYIKHQGFHHVYFVRPLEGMCGNVKSSPNTLWGKRLLKSTGGIPDSPSAYVAFYKSCRGELNSSLTEMTHSWDTGRRAFAMSRSDPPPLFVGYFLTVKNFTCLQNVFDSEEHRRSSWLIFLNPGMTSAIDDLHLPLDHKAVFAIVHNDIDKKTIRVDLWDMYKAAPHFVPKKIYLGRWSSKEWRPSHDRSHQELLWKEALSNSEQERQRLEKTPSSLQLREQQHHPLLPFFTREPWERRNDLMGLVIRCTIIQEYPYIMYNGVNKDGTVSFDGMRGINGELFHILKQTLNFTPHCFENVDQTWGSLREGKWIGMVADLVEGRADIAVSEVELNYARSQVIDYPYGWQIGGYRLMMRQVPAIGNAGNSYTKEFTWQVWLLVMMFGVMLCLSLLFVLRKSPHNEEMSLSEVIWLTVAAFCNAGESVSTKSLSSRILLLVLYLTIMMLHAYYNSFLISSLTVESNSLPFTTLEGMYEAGTHSFGLIGRLSIEDIIKFSPVPLHKLIWDEMIMADPSNLSPTLRDAGTRLCTRNHVLMVSENWLWTKDWPCKIQFLPDAYFFSQRTMPLRKDSPLLAAFRFQMKKLVEAGIADRVRKKWKRNPVPPGTERSPISLLQASTAFLLLLIGISSALVLLGIEVILSKLQERKNNTKD